MAANDTIEALQLQEKLLKRDLRAKTAPSLDGAMLDSQWTSDVSDVRSFLDEDYSVPLSGGGYAQRNLTPGQAQLPWGRIGIEKWNTRVIPLLSGAEASRWQPVVSVIKQACKDAVSFGNSTIIVDSEGELRVSTPETGMATQTPFTNSFVEDFGSVKTMAADDGLLAISRDGGETWADSGAAVFSIFHGADGAHPRGSSRLTPAIRACIRAASRNKIRSEIAANFYAFPQRIINGAWEGMDRSVGLEQAKLVSGASTVQVIPKDPDTNERLEIQQLPAASFEPFIAMQKQLATEVATGFGISYDELGVTTNQPQSADAIYALKEGLSLAITSWEQEITSTLQAMLVRVAEIWGVDTPVLSWQEPALPSKGSAADAAIKLVSAFPALKDSKAVLAWAGLPASVLEAVVKELGGDYDGEPTLAGGERDGE